MEHHILSVKFPASWVSKVDHSSQLKKYWRHRPYTASDVLVRETIQDLVIAIQLLVSCSLESEASAISNSSPTAVERYWPNA